MKYSYNLGYLNFVLSGGAYGEKPTPRTHRWAEERVRSKSHTFTCHL